MEKVKSIGEGKPFTTPHGVIYYHSIAFESGKTGQFTTKSSPQTKFIIGKEYNITEEEKTNGSGKYIFFNILKEDFKKGSGQSYYDKPEVQARITQNSAIQYAIDTISRIEKVQPEVIKPGMIMQLQNVYVNWVLQLGEEPNVQLARRSALSLAVATMDVKAENINGSVDILALAEKYYNIVK